ncbi:tumor necrosis factor receptor superfamily member 13C [Rhea pennata]|uniref:tumor necrosis factor receptor superfamily member 13C n=1 Tax=Rhea pennata TaxID=8795 RepID=UPI002E25B505
MVCLSSFKEFSFYYCIGGITESQAQKPQQGSHSAPREERAVYHGKLWQRNTSERMAEIEKATEQGDLQNQSPRALRFHTWAASLSGAMQEDSSPAQSIMSSGKADTSASCLPSQCFDSLTRSCVKCSELYNDNTKPAHAAPTSALIPSPPSADLRDTILIFGVPAAVGLILALAAVWGFLTWKMGRQKRKRKKPDEESKESLDKAISSSSPLQHGSTALAADDDLALAKCPHANGAVEVPGPLGKDTAKQRLCCQGSTGGDIIPLSAVSPCLKECNHCFPLPATELGAAALVTTKTTQKTCINEEIP